jgi:hypothetical protein
MTHTAPMKSALGVSLVIGVAVLSVACSQEITTSSEPIEADESELSGKPIQAGEVVRLGPTFATREGIATEAAAHALEAAVREDARRQGHTACVFADWASHEPAQLSAKLVNLETTVTATADGKFNVTASSTQTYCAAESLDNARIVLFDGTLHTLNPVPLEGGTKVILDVDMRVTTNAASTHDNRGNDVVALVPHLRMRFDGGLFGEVSGMPRVNGKRGDVINVQAPLPDHAMILRVPAKADRIEAYFRFDRWSYDRVATEGGTITGKLDLPTRHGYVSNGGKNFTVGVR